MDAKQILHILDNNTRQFTFPMLDNGYVYLAATRLSLFRSSEDWGLVIEVFGYSPRAGLPDTHLYTFASRLHDRDKREKYVDEAAYQNYLANNPHNESRLIRPIADGPWIDSELEELVATSGELHLRDLTLPLPSTSQYAQEGVDLEDDRPAVFELCRYLAAKWRDKVLASPTELRVSILPSMTQILQLEEWFHPDVANDELPSDCETFQQLAELLTTGSVSHYHPSRQPNTHWSNWPDGGSL